MTVKDRYALTIHRPWSDAIVYGTKRIENRTWKPPAGIKGQPIAIHSGKKYDLEGAEWMRDEGLFTPRGGFYSPLGIVGVATVIGYVTESHDPWFVGPVGWLLDKVIALREPVPCRGAQGLWFVPADVLAKVRGQLR